MMPEGKYTEADIMAMLVDNSNKLEEIKRLVNEMLEKKYRQ